LIIKHVYKSKSAHKICKQKDIPPLLLKARHVCLAENQTYLNLTCQTEIKLL